jgi:iron(III) transport system ATP-binding protein
MTVALSIEDVALRRGGRRVIEHVSLDIDPGECVVLAGESGSGKTSLLRLVAGFDRPERGAIRIGARLVDDAARCFVPPEARGLAMVFQDFALWPHLSVLENVALVIRERAGREKKALTLLEAFGVGACASRLPAMLSGGQQQRVGLARALAASPQLLMLDEPFSSLDVETRDALRTELRALVVETGLTALCVSHDPVDGQRLADRIAVLEAGAISQYARPEAMFAAPASPYVARLAGLSGGVPVDARMANGNAIIALGGGDFCVRGVAGKIGDTGRALLFWQPDAIGLADAGIPARCIEAHFDAGRWQALVRVDGVATPMPISCVTRPSPGQVTVHVDPGGLHLFPAEMAR